jgi:N-acetylmuramoyl-L-alanine amidase
MHKSRRNNPKPTYYSYRSNRPIEISKPRHKRHLARFTFVCAVALIGYIIISASLTHAGDQQPKVPTYSKSQTICLDPGHGGVDPGATSLDGTIIERDINLQVALSIRQILNTQGYQVFMTRTDNNTAMTNGDRYNYCNSKKATILVSIHHNVFSDDSVDYDTALFYKPSDQGLATSILSASSLKLNIQNNGVAQFDDGVLSESNMPAAVSEGFFITSSSEYNILKQTNSTRLSDEAQGIANGIINYLKDPTAADAAVTAGAPVLTQSSD